LAALPPASCRSSAFNPARETEYVIETYLVV
jgi:hypothetical protein